MTWLDARTPMQRARHIADQRHLQDAYRAELRAKAQMCADLYAEKQKAATGATSAGLAGSSRQAINSSFKGANE